MCFSASGWAYFWHRLVRRPGSTVRGLLVLPPTDALYHWISCGVHRMLAQLLRPSILPVGLPCPSRPSCVFDPRYDPQ
eukprot:scaffold431_cov334-Pavlova_lutheri.AAC.77